MGYLRWCMWVVALVLAALKGKGPLYRWLRDLSRSLDASLAHAREVRDAHASTSPVRDPVVAAIDEIEAEKRQAREDARLVALDDESRVNVGDVPRPPVDSQAMHFEDGRGPLVGNLTIYGDPAIIGQRLSRAHARERAEMDRRRRGKGGI